MSLVVIESPFAARAQLPVRQYLAHCFRDCFARGEDPFASHAMYTRYLKDDMPDQRTRGIDAGFRWAEKADYRAFYLDLGLSSGMLLGLRHAIRIGQPIYVRALAKWRGPKRIEALRKLNGEIGYSSSVEVDWSGW